jgi:muramoyltetrapeptide carboxypeptidase LdcA involved in peptidoglycan recycling
MVPTITAGRVKENEHDLRNLRERLTAAFATIDIEVVFAQHAFGRYGFLAGTDEERAEDLHWAFQDKSISAILALRGGWGCARLLKLVRDLRVNSFLFQAHPANEARSRVRSIGVSFRTTQSLSLDTAT